MQPGECNLRAAAVTYRASLSSGQGVKMHLVLPCSQASLFDAWSRFNAAYDEVDPTSIEMEVRRPGPLLVERTSVRDLARAMLRGQLHPGRER